MSNIDIKIINSTIENDHDLLAALSEGFRIAHAINYTDKVYNDKLRYTSEGQTYYENVLTDEINCIKYILERDGITRLLHG